MWRLFVKQIPNILNTQTVKKKRNNHKHTRYTAEINALLHIYFLPTDQTQMYCEHKEILNKGRAYWLLKLWGEVIAHWQGTWLACRTEVLKCAPCASLECGLIRTASGHSAQVPHKALLFQRTGMLWAVVSSAQCPRRPHDRTSGQT